MGTAVTITMKSQNCALLVVSSFSMAMSLTYLFLFSLPHSTWIPASPAWQEVSLKIVTVGVSPNTSWIPPDDGHIMLISVVSAVGTLGFNRDEAYMFLFPHWQNILNVASIFSLLNIVACYLIFEYVLSQPKRVYLMLPWIVLSGATFLVLLFFLGTLLGYLPNTTRIRGELREPIRNYDKVVTGVIVFTLVHYAASLVVILHYIEAKEEQFTSDIRLMAVVADRSRLNSQVFQPSDSHDFKDENHTARFSQPPGYKQVMASASDTDGPSITTRTNWRQQDPIIDPGTTSSSGIPRSLPGNPRII